MLCWLFIFVDTVCLEKSTLPNCSGISDFVWNGIFTVAVYPQGKQLRNSSPRPPASLQWSFFIFNASVISGALILQAPLFLSPACRPGLCVTSGRNLKSYLATMVNVSNTNGRESCQKRPRAGWPHDLAHGNYHDRNGLFFSNKTQGERGEVKKHSTVSEHSWWTHIPPYSSIAETWPNLLTT